MNLTKTMVRRRYSLMIMRQFGTEDVRNARKRAMEKKRPGSGNSVDVKKESQILQMTSQMLNHPLFGARMVQQKQEEATISSAEKEEEQYASEEERRIAMAKKIEALLFEHNMTPELWSKLPKAERKARKGLRDKLLKDQIECLQGISGEGLAGKTTQDLEAPDQVYDDEYKKTWVKRGQWAPIDIYHPGNTDTYLSDLLEYGGLENDDDDDDDDDDAKMVAQLETDEYNDDIDTGPTPLASGRWIWGVPGLEKEAVIEMESFRMREAKMLFESGSDYIGGGKRTNHLENKDSPEVCFIGRSNVGKSSLINRLLGINKNNSKVGAYVSRRPGRTVAMHQFALGRNDTHRSRQSLPNYRLVLTDLPGYGFAKQNAQGQKEMEKIITNYINTRDVGIVVRIIMLVDAGVGLTPNDVNMYSALKYAGAKTQIVLTKCDRVSENELDTQVQFVLDFLSRPDVFDDGELVYPMVLGISSKKKHRTPQDRSGFKYHNVFGDYGIDRLRANLLAQADNLFYRKRSSTRKTIFSNKK